MIEQAGQLYHTLPLGIIGYHNPIASTPIFIESSACMQREAYKHFFVSRRFDNTILDCGVGMTPDLKNPTAHTSNDPHWAVKYLGLILDIQPRVVIIPDILNNAQKTLQNYYDYIRIFNTLSCRIPELMYVIQGKTKGDAVDQIELVCSTEFIGVKWIGFPRIVDYYGDLTSDVLANQRIRFVTNYLSKLRKVGYKVHLLGMNSVDELKFAAYHNISVDTRLASMAAIVCMSVTAKRRNKLDIDLVRSFTSVETSDTLKNMEILNRIYHASRKC